MQHYPKISFGIIVLNGEPFTKYCLRALYPFAHEIIVVEGAVRSAADIATPTGHSRDNTLEILYQFQAEEDPEGKLQIVVREGFWDEKDEMSQAYAARATGDYLWQVDIDEFYLPKDIETVMQLLRADPSITGLSFKNRHFWGGFDYVCNGWYFRTGADVFRRLFKWGEGYQYVSHRPPTVFNAHGEDTYQLNWLDGQVLARKHNIYLYHYSLLFPKQVLEKSQYYSRVAWTDRTNAVSWAERNFLKLEKPYRVHNVYRYPSWLERYSGPHPPQIEALRHALRHGTIPIEMRRTDDIEDLLCQRRYAVGRAMLKLTSPVFSLAFHLVKGVSQRLSRRN